jgi:thiol-disulfide isomerase/thioredoxin
MEFLMHTGCCLRLAFFAIAMMSVTHFARADEKIPSANAPENSTVPFKIGLALQDIPNEEIEKAYEGKVVPEAIRMYLAISRGSRMGAGDGWFGPAQSRYTWEWLAEQHGASEEGIEADKFRGSPELFRRLDRNLNGKITPEDLDWSERNSWVQNSYLVNRLFRKSDPNGDGELSREEWLAFFDAAARGKSGLTSEDLRDAWLAGMSSNFLPGDAPTKEILLQGLFKGEVGSLQEGPMPGEPAPDFTLTTQDGKQTIQLSKVIGQKPVVLVFGNFTCGPFRSMYPGVEAVYRRFKDDAVFLGIYVREAHPTDGWKMESNAKVGVEVAQPKTFAERTAVAQQCHQLLKPTIPLLVDEIDDRTGNAYSGMPARLYVVDSAGRIAYKSGRGPFGFKTGEMEQALVMTLLDEAIRVKPAATSEKQ